MPDNLIGTGALTPAHEAHLVAQGAVHVWWVHCADGNRILGVSKTPLPEAATQVMQSARASVHKETALVFSHAK